MKNPESENELNRGDEMETIRVTVDPGICGFVCAIRARKEGRHVTFDIQSECNQIKNLAERLGPVTVRDLFVPLTKSPFFLSAEKSKCHLACPIPSSLVKTAEVVLGLALPKEVTVRFLK